MKVSPYLLLSFTSLFWSWNFIIGKLIGVDIPPATISFCRWGLPAIFLVPFFWGDIRKNWSVYRRHLLLVFVLGSTGFSLNSLCVYTALRYTSAINTSFINAFNPVLIALVGFAFYRFPTSRVQVFGFVVSLVGVSWIIFKGDPSLILGLKINVGDLLMLGSIAFWSVYTTVHKHYINVLPFKSFFAVVVFAGAMVTFPLMIIENVVGGTAWMNHLGVKHIGGLLALSLFPSVLAVYFWNKALATISANKVAIFQYLIPVYTVIFSLLFLGEHLGAYHLVGGVFIFAGVVMVTRQAPDRTLS
jgi:drug/metabolite transporter (DMT)-like permease